MGVEWAAAVKTLGSTSLGGHPVPQMCLTCSPFPKARFLTGTDKVLGSSTSSDNEEDPLPANKCKKVRGPDPAVPSAWASAETSAWLLRGGLHWDLTGVGTSSLCCCGIG